MAAILATIAACGGGGGEGGGGGGAPLPPPPPVVLSVDRVLDPASPTTFAVLGADFPGAVGASVVVRFTASDGLMLSACGDPSVEVTGTRSSATSVQSTTPAFILTRGVAAWVSLDFGGGVTAASATPIATLVGSPTDILDQDLDGIPDGCDPKTYAFASSVGTRPADTTPIDGPGQPALAIVDRAGDASAAFTGNGNPIAYERFDRATADFPFQNTTIYADLDPTGGSINLELGNEGSYAGAAGGSLIFQVQSSNATVFYERQWNQILHAVNGPALPVSGRVRLRWIVGDGIAGALHFDGLVGATWQNDLVVYDVPDARPYRGLELAASNYGGGSRAIRRMTVVREVPNAPFTLAKSPARSMDRQVFQRGPGGTAAIPFRLLYRLPLGGTVEARVVRSATGEVLPGFDFADHVFQLPRRPVGRIDLAVPSVPQGGNYDVEVRVLDETGAVVGQQALLDLGVGDVYVAAGQSNMSGTSGNLFGVDAPSELSHLFHNDGTWKQGQEPMDDGYNQTDLISREFPQSSCLLAFANELSLRTGIPVGIVPTSLGGTNLYSQWQRYAPFHAHRITLYGSMIARAKLACPGTPPKGLLWFQGESDALASRTTAQHLADLQRFVAQSREDLAAPSLVFLCGQLGTYDAANQPYWVGVQEAQRELVLADPLSQLVTAADLPKADSIHFSVAGYRTMGQRFAKGARKLVFGHATDPTDDLVSAALGAGNTSVVLTYERPVTGGNAGLFRATDAGGALTVNTVVAAGNTVTVTLNRSVGNGGRLAYGYSNLYNDAWVKDAADASPVPLFDAVVLTP